MEPIKQICTSEIYKIIEPTKDGFRCDKKSNNNIHNPQSDVLAVIIDWEEMCSYVCYEDKFYPIRHTTIINRGRNYAIGKMITDQDLINKLSAGLTKE